MMDDPKQRKDSSDNLASEKCLNFVLTINSLLPSLSSVLRFDPYLCVF